MVVATDDERQCLGGDPLAYRAEDLPVFLGEPYTTVRRRQSVPQRCCNHDPRASFAARRLLGGDPPAMLRRPKERWCDARPPSLQSHPRLFCSQSVLGQVSFLSEEKICFARLWKPFLEGPPIPWN